MSNDVKSSVQALLPSEWSEKRLDRFASVLPCMLYEYVMTLDGQRELLFVGSNCHELLELYEEEFIGNPNLFAAMVNEEDIHGLIAADVTANLRGVPFASEVRIQTKSGCQKWIHLASRPNTATDGGLVIWTGFMLDITERKNMEDQIRQLALYDPLTNLPNRRLITDRLGQLMNTCDRNGTKGALMVLDLDNFKVANDRFGHKAGDLLLIETAARLKEVIRETDTVGRFGGDEFVIILSELGTGAEEAAQQALALAEKVRSSLAKPFLLDVAEPTQATETVMHKCGVSIGVTLFNGSLVEQEGLFAAADAAMYLAKEAGRNQIRLAAP